MDQPTTNQKRLFIGKRGWVWSIPVLIAVILFFNHFYQWYHWPWQETTSPLKKQSTRQIVDDPKLSPVIEHAKTKDDSHQDLKELARERKSKSLDTEQPAQKLVIDYEKIKNDSHQDVKKLVQERKKELGLDKSVDMVVKSGEHIRIGKEVIPLDQILAEIEAQGKGRTPSVDPLQLKPPMPETRFPSISRPTRPIKRPANYYGIYLVRSGDNLWDIHFTFLREYFDSRGITISAEADKPLGTQSSGIGRILKYAEKMVYIFNIKTKKLSRDINLLKPLEKIVIFNISNLYNILGPLTEKKLNTIRFDGQDLIVPG